MIRDMVDSRDDKTLSQGTIFNCAYSAGYLNEEILGLIITARCDIANKNKVNFFNFIPAIPFSLWKEKEAYVLLHKKIYTSLYNQFLQLIVNANFSEGNLLTYGYESVLQKIKEQKNIKSNEISKLENLGNKIKILDTEKNFKILSQIFQKDLHEIIKGIIEHKDSDYFFIDEIKGYGPVIVKLREIYELDISLAKSMPGGIELTDRATFTGLNPNAGNNFCSIVAQLKSPYIELLLQRFTNNFIRIGVENPHSLLSKHVMGSHEL